MLRHLHCIGKVSVFCSRDTEVLVRLLFSQYPAKTIKLLKEVNVCRLCRVLPLFEGDLVLVGVFVCCWLVGFF